MNHKSIIVIPHMDDEIFQAGGILLNYPNDIQLLITHPTDCISKERYDEQVKMFLECMQIINSYRETKQFPRIEYFIFENATFNGYMSDEGRKEIQNQLEYCLDSDTKIDYFVFTEESTHQSHQECNHIAMSCCRSPYIEKCKDIMLATYPQSSYGIKFDGYHELNSYLPLSDIQVDLMCDCIGKIYGEKNQNTTILGADNFRTFLKFYGSKCGKKYAQPFSSLRHIYTMNN